ncbi:UbiH/UbiF family hydroxylase [Nitrosospira sp. Nsp1]|uniref:UbiH/UbiF family hydroxylase n=1 Tax=Nitrosospira sp. Nsp1 TaxID=136547 RepID=UPI00088C298F|nr:UbiH/UbiF family hydroxylase [Nitrosospira sp. Nsp1]SCX48245.1 2-octaprenyl-3-methyl-6-methoxy-1,4-benzoquinol hydroxylase [Nitrosospira sp. Nsp1]
MKFDVIIVGGGLVGASLALALKDSGLKIALVESRPPLPLPVDDSWDSRIYAISPGSTAFLQNLEVWQTLDKSRMSPVYNMAVFGDDSAARIDFSAYDIGFPELAFILENRQLQAAVWEALKRRKKHLKIFCPAQCTSITWADSHADLQLADGNVLQGSLIVGADGLNSWVREQAEITVVRHSYQQTGVVANFNAERRHNNIAHQWFRRDGVLALLPLPDNRVSMVWSAREELARKLLGLPEAELCQQVAEASCHTLGELQLVTRPAAFPLNFVHVNKLVQSRLALIGDAAHGIHPLAGQGVNLGLRDAHELASTLMSRGLQPDCGDYRLLRRYERARKEDILAMELVTDGLQKLFSNPNPTLVRLRNLGLGITNRLPLIKDRLMQHALS